MHLPQRLNFSSASVTSPVEMSSALYSVQDLESRQVFCLSPTPFLTAELCLVSIEKEEDRAEGVAGSNFPVFLPVLEDLCLVLAQNLGTSGLSVPSPVFILHLPGVGPE